MERDTAVFYGIGVGPGDPELLTLKAVRIIRECPVIALPAENKENCVSYRIGSEAIPELKEKEILYLPMPMTMDKELQKQSHDTCAGKVEEYLEKGISVAFLTLGDPTVYSTYGYLEERLKKKGLSTCTINGVTSFCNAAALLQTSLAAGSEKIHIIPGLHDVEETLRQPGTKVIMKSGRKYKELVQRIRELGLRAMMAENCGMAEERIYEKIEDFPAEAGYFTLIIIKEQEG